MTARPNGILAAIALLIVGVAIGVAADRWLATSPGSSDVAAAHDDSGRDVAAALTELRRAIDNLPASVREQVRDELSSTTNREPVDTSESETSRLTRAVEQLNELLGKSGGGVGALRVRARGGLEPWQGSGYASLDDMRLRIEGIRRDNGDDWNDSADEEITKAHLLWTREDVLDRYGAPNRVGQAHGMDLVYDQHLFKLPNQRCWFAFTICEGVVTEVYFDCEDDR